MTAVAPDSRHPTSSGDALLEIRDLHTDFVVHGGTVAAVQGVNLTLPPGKTTGLVGESGCGKSVTALSIMGLLESNGRVASGEIIFKGKNLLKMSGSELRSVRGNDISMIFQEPMTALNPVYTVGDQIAESIELHQALEKSAAREKAVEMLGFVGIAEPKRRAGEYPHQLSGGMRQRVMIAMALACDPELLIADEPTTALDVTIQAQILALMSDLQKRTRAAILLITHDLGVVAEMCDEVAVMYAGRIVEHASTRDIFASPKHPYTQGLLSSIPRLGHKRARLNTIKGNVPNPLAVPRGCPFHPRCPKAFQPCPKFLPPLEPVAPDHVAACFLYPEVAAHIPQAAAHAPGPIA